MKQEIEQLIKYYEDKGNKAAYYYKKYEEVNGPNYFNLGIIAICNNIVPKLKALLKVLDSKDTSEETPDTL